MNPEQKEVAQKLLSFIYPLDLCKIVYDYAVTEYINLHTSPILYTAREIEEKMRYEKSIEKITIGVVPFVYISSQSFLERGYYDLSVSRSEVKEDNVYFFIINYQYHNCPNYVDPSVISEPGVYLIKRDSFTNTGVLYGEGREGEEDRVVDAFEKCPFISDKYAWFYDEEDISEMNRILVKFLERWKTVNDPSNEIMMYCQGLGKIKLGRGREGGRETVDYMFSRYHA